MTWTRLLTVAVLFCAVSVFAQEQPSAGTRPNRTAEPEKAAPAAPSEPWKIVQNQPADLNAGENRLQQFQIDAYKIDPFRIDPIRPSRWGWQIDPVVNIVVMDGQFGDDTLCYTMRSYVVARDDKDSDSVHAVGYSTCQTASRYRLKKTLRRTDPSGK